MLGKQAFGLHASPTNLAFPRHLAPLPLPPPQVFKAHYHTILRLKSFFPFSLIDAMVGCCWAGMSWERLGHHCAQSCCCFSESLS